MYNYANIILIKNFVNTTIWGKVMEEFNLVNLGNIGEPAADVTNNFINKISSALGWIFSPKNIKPAIIDANKSIIEEIAHREDINPIERSAIISNYKKFVKEYKNQMDVMKVALEHLNPNSEPEKVNDDWITFFFDKVKNVNEDYMKAIWGKILAGEFNEPNTYTKQLLHTMSIMDSRIAKRFQKIRSSCFFSPPILLAFMYRTNGDSIKNIKAYDKMKIFIYDLRELDSLGLIQYRFSDFHTLVIKNKVFYYGNKVIKFETDKRTIALGNVALTSVGKQLCRIVPMEYDDKILGICLDSWRKLGYNPIVEIIEND